MSKSSPSIGGEHPTLEEDLAKDVLEIMTVFSACLVGSRSRKKKRLLDDIKRVAEAAGDDPRPPYCRVTTLAKLPTGETISGPKPHQGLLGRLRRLSRSLSRKVKGSANSAKAKVKLSRLHARIANVRKDALHKRTIMLTTRFELIGIENLNVAGMVANRTLARAISDMGFFEFRRQLEYKAALHGAKAVIADRFFPSSKLCSDCGFRAEMNLGVRHDLHQLR